MILDLFRLDHQVAMVTGTHQGIGQGMALALAEAGADIVALDRSDPVETRTAVTALGRRFHWLHVDLAVATPDSLADLVATALQTAGRLDILVNNAGITRRAGVLELTEADWDVVLQVNLKTAFFLAQAAGRHFVAQGHGKIINVTSMLAYQGGIRVPSYAAAKSGMAGITRAMANELASQNVNVNAIAPGYILTNHTQMLHDDAGRNPGILARIPAGHWGAPGDLGGAVVYLASAASAYCHGMILNVDGGWLSR
jgi:2-dehydro-3-deoxy-D-gluconate 5-dehydrogenase